MKPVLSFLVFILMLLPFPAEAQVATPPQEDFRVVKDSGSVTISVKDLFPDSVISLFHSFCDILIPMVDSMNYKY